MWGCTNPPHFHGFLLHSPTFPVVLLFSLGCPSKSPIYDLRNHCCHRFDAIMASYCSCNGTKIRFYRCNMHKSFVSVARKIFPQAVIRIDMFHVIKHLNDYVSEIRRQIQHNLEPSDPDYKLLKGSICILVAKQSSIDTKYDLKAPIVKKRIAKLLQQTYKSFPSKLYVKEFETELAVAEYTIHKAEESFQILRNDYRDLQEYVSILQDILTKTGFHFQSFTAN